MEREEVEEYAKSLMEKYRIPKRARMLACDEAYVAMQDPNAFKQVLERPEGFGTLPSMTYDIEPVERVVVEEKAPDPARLHKVWVIRFIDQDEKVFRGYWEMTFHPEVRTVVRFRECEELYEFPAEWRLAEDAAPEEGPAEGSEGTPANEQSKGERDGGREK